MSEDRVTPAAVEQVRSGVIQVQLKLRPTKSQARMLDRWLWHMTGLWNWTLGTLANSPRRMSYMDLNYLLKGHSQRLGVPSNVLTGTAWNAHTAWRRYTTGIARKPRLKGIRRKLSSLSFSHWRTQPKNGRYAIPYLGPIRFHRQEIPKGHIGTARIVKRASGWYLCLFVHAVPRPIEHVGDGEIGIDPGFSNLLTLSTGEKVEHPHEWAADESRLGQAKRGHRKQLAARLQERTANRRKDRNHKLSRRLVAENRLIAFSADRHSSIARRFGKSVGSAGHYQLRRMLSYKSLTGGRAYIEVDSRNSTRTCSACGALSGPTGWDGLKVRQWTCGACGAQHDRDCNAAVNTLIAGRGARQENRREAVS